MSPSEMQTDWLESVAILVGDVIRNRRRELGMSQRQLADLVGTYRPNVGRVERGRHVPRLVILADYARVLGLPLSVFGQCVDDAGPFPLEPERARRLREEIPERTRTKDGRWRRVRT